MAGFLDWIESGGSELSPVIASAIPSILTGMLVKKPKMDMNALSSYYNTIANAAGQANAFAEEDRATYDQHARPAAVAFNQRAQGIGGSADLDAHSSRNAANFRNAYGAARAKATQDMTGMNPNAGGPMARMGAMDASYAPGVVQALNTGRFEREQYGDEMRAKAISLFPRPNYVPGMGGLGIAASGAANLANQANRMYREEAGDVAKTLKLPFDYMDENRRRKDADKKYNDMMGILKQRFPVNIPSTQGPRPNIWSGLGGEQENLYGE
jgi:hypothetical protein